jgi:hypothetical protein
MARGVPVAAAPTDALPELLEGYAPGAVVPFDLGERDPLFTRLREWAAAPPPRTPDPRFTTEAMVEGYLAVYDEALRRAGRNA